MTGSSEANIMHKNILPDGELLRRAVLWINEQGQYTPKILEEACIRYNLSPNDEEFLLRTFAPPSHEHD
jgi:hypothetical protein